MKKLTTNEFVTNANNIHDGKYKYPDEYINARTKIKIICPIHGDFHQIPNKHIKGYGCSKCSNKHKPTKKEFIQQANNIHDGKYKYPDEYVNNKTKIKIICPIHGEFCQTPSNHLRGSGCKKCVFKYSNLNNITFQILAHNVHNNKYVYSNDYINSYTLISIKCPIHGYFKQLPRTHLKGSGCLKCIQLKQKSNASENFKINARKIHGDKYEYIDDYISSNKKINIICKKHGIFKQRPGDHINKQTNCPLCSYKNYSKQAICWLNEISKKENIHIQHAENGGEYYIPTTNYKADGYCEANNTIYEFYGDIWHGNLNIFNENEVPRPFLKMSAGSLYMKTMQREQEIKNLGYNLITIWENDFIKSYK